MHYTLPSPLLHDLCLLLALILLKVARREPTGKESTVEIDGIWREFYVKGVEICRTSRNHNINPATPLTQNDVDMCCKGK